MTQNSDSGDAVGDAGPTTDMAGSVAAQGKKRLNSSAILSICERHNENHLVTIPPGVMIAAAVAAVDA
jgi:hypothetical protein